MKLFGASLPSEAAMRGWLLTGRANGQPSHELHTSHDVVVTSDNGLLVVARGTPVFTDPRLAERARTQGIAKAWLDLYRRAGANAPNEVVGRFATVILEPEVGRAMACIDRFAIETLCYAASADGFAFAERADRVPGASRSIDDQALFDYLYSHVIPSPRTILRGVSRLPPAHRVVFDNGRVVLEPYWQPAFDEDHPASLASLRDEFRKLLRQAVDAVARTPALGCFLSGGLDSTTVAGMIGEVTGRPARTYSIGFAVDGYDEMRYARIAARHFGCVHHEYYVTPRDLLDHLARLAADFDQPFGNSSALPSFCCAKMAHKDGIRTMLAGDGGDELFGGNARYAKQKVFDIYDALPAVVRKSLLEPFATGHAARLPPFRKLASYVEQASAPLPDRLEMYNLLIRIGLEEVFAPEFLARVHVGAPLEARRQTFAGIEATSSTNRMLAYDWKFVLADNDLRKVLGAASGARIAVEFPLLDHRLVEFSLKLRASHKVRGLALRWFFKHALADFLPPETIAKRKHGFGLPFGTWALANAELKAFAVDALMAVKRRGFIRAAFVDDLVERLLPEHPGYYGEMVWVLMTLELWLRAHEAIARA